MYAEENYWSVTLFAENRTTDLDVLKRVLKWCQQKRIQCGSAFIFEYPWMKEKEKREWRRFTPYVWLPYHDESATSALLHEAGINPPPIRFEKVESNWDDPPSLHPLLPP